MKKIVLSTLLLGLTYTTNSQVLLSENFDELTVGQFAIADPIESTIAKSFAAQGEWYIATSMNPTSQSTYQIVTVSGDDKRFSFSGSPSSVGSNFAKRVLDNSTIEGSNDLYVAKFKFNTGAEVVNSKNEFSIGLTNSDASGFMAGMRYFSASKQLVAMYSDFNPTNNKVELKYTSLNLDPASLVLENNKDYFCQFSYEFSSREMQYRIAPWNNPTAFLVDVTFAAQAEFLVSDLSLFLFKASAGTDNAAAKTIGFDEITVEAIAGKNNAGLGEVESAIFSIFPNPSSDLVTVQLSDITKVNDAIRFTSLDGKLIENRKITSLSEKFDVSALTPGIYFFEIGTTTQKVVVQ